MLCMVLTQNKLCFGFLCHHESFLYICEIAFSTLTISMKVLEQDNFNLNQLQLLALTSLPGIWYLVFGIWCMVYGTSNCGKVVECDVFRRFSSLRDLRSGKKKEALPCICLIICFILIFLSVMSMILFCVVMLGKQLLER